MSTKANFTMIPIKKVDVFQEVINRLESLLDSGNFPPGSRLPAERELAEQFQVSRTSIRQALKVMEASGKLQTKMGSGTYVAEQPLNTPLTSNWATLPATVDSTFLNQLVSARTGVERAVFDECLAVIDNQGLEELEQLLRDNALYVQEKDDSEGSGLDLSFENKVAEIAGNSILSHIQQDVHKLWILAWNAYGFEPGSAKDLHKEHEKILDAFKMRDRDLLLALIVNHVNKTIS